MAMTTLSNTGKPWLRGWRTALPSIAWLVPAIAAVAVLIGEPAWAQPKTRNVVLIVLDGLRWQEMFSGADPGLLNEKHGGIWESEATLRKRFWDADPLKRRELLFPFLWDVMATQGQIFGNQKLGSIGQVTNAHRTSYPGYSEMSTGHADPGIGEDEQRPNPNLNVFEWLNQRPDLAGKVAIFGSWHLYREIFNTPRSHLYIQAGASLPPTDATATPTQALLNRLYQTTPALEEGDVLDAFVQVPLLDYVKSAHPRVLFVGYGETDDWAHSGRYDLVLESAHHSDGFVRELWDTMQAMPEYRDQTTFIVTTDHGRGSGLVEWKEHGVAQKGSENIWIAVIGPDTAALGERRGPPAVKQAQIAATIAALLGSDYRAAEPAAAPPLPVVGEH
jgi:hypothetical protein